MTINIVYERREFGSKFRNSQLYTPGIHSPIAFGILNLFSGDYNMGKNQVIKTMIEVRSRDRVYQLLREPHAYQDGLSLPTVSTSRL